MSAKPRKAPPGARRDPEPHRHDDHDALYVLLADLKTTLAQLVDQTRESQLQRRLEQVPVRTSDLMRGFEAAVARANRATRAGDVDGEDIERMSVQSLEVTLTAPLIDGGHAEDPVFMLPNIKSADAQSAEVGLKFAVVSVPTKPQV
jgi:hypothetical protein